MAHPLIATAILSVALVLPTAASPPAALSGRSEVLADYLASGLALTRAVAAADFDGDGIEDLVIAFDTPAGPALGFRKGNFAALYPHHPGAGVAGEPFGGPVLLRALEVRGDFLFAGDFTGDGLPDVVAGARGSRQVSLTRGNGTFSPAKEERRLLPGAVLTMAKGSLWRVDGVPDLVVSLQGAGTVSLGTEIRVARQISSLEASAIEIGWMDAGPDGDVALTAGRLVHVIRGETRRIDRGVLPFSPSSLALMGHGSTARLAASGQGHLALIDTGGAQFGGPALSVRGWADLGLDDGAPLIPAYRTGAREQDLVAGRTLIPNATLRALPGLQGRDVHGLPSPALQTQALAYRPARSVLGMRLNPDALTDLVFATGRSAPEIDQTTVVNTFTVNSLLTEGDGDTDDGVCDTGPDGDNNFTGLCTLNAAAEQANASPGADAIRFALPGSGPFILSGGSLSEINGALTIDGTSQPGYAGSPIVVLSSTGLGFEDGSSVVRGVILNVEAGDFRPVAAVDLSRAGNVIVESSWIGLDPTGTVSNPDGLPQSGDELGAHYGVWIRSSSNTIGGAAEAARNVISGAYDGDGVLISSGSATGNTVEGNYIGTDPTGSVAHGNAVRGVSISNAASGNTIRDNVVSGNGVLLSDPSFSGAGIAVQFNSMLVVNDGTPVDQPPNSNLIVGNRVGTDATGTTALPNARGILIDYASNNTVGGPVDSLRNIISGNVREGLYVRGTYGTTDGNIVVNNYIGVSASGAGALGNGTDGVRIGHATSTTIGGEAGNVIASNGSRGVAIESSSGDVVTGNRIGTDATGLLDRGNSSAGIQVSSSSGVAIGDGSAAGRNLISSNASGGIFISGSSSAVTVRGNYIGTDVTGSGNLGNGFDGIRILGISGHVIGGTEAGQGNVIAFNALNGVGIFNGSTYTVSGNSIFENGSLGIDLGIDGVTLNDAEGMDADTGPNGLQNFPFLGFLDSERVLVQFTSTPSTPFTLEFFANETCDESDHGEGRRFLEARSYETDAQGSVEVQTTFALEEDEDFLTATATGPDGSTSEFSRCSDDLRLIVNTVGDAPDADLDNPACDTGADVIRGTDEESECTLRAAIQQANKNNGADEITFDIIAGSAPHTIQIGSGLDPIPDSLTIDGTTQTGFVSGSPAVILAGGTSVENGLTFTGGGPHVRGLDVRSFDYGIASSGVAVDLGEMTFSSNRFGGLRVTGDAGQTSRISGPLILTGNGSGSPPCFGAAIAVDGHLETDAVTASDNCATAMNVTGGRLTIDGDASFTGGGGWGIRADELVLGGSTNLFHQNLAGAALVARSVTVAGSLTVSDNGPLGEPSCLDIDSGAFIGGELMLASVTASNNCGSGLWAEDGSLTATGNVTATGNRGAGLRAVGSVALEGSEHRIQSNGLDGIFSAGDRVSISGSAVVQLNGTEVDPALCTGTSRGGVYGGDITVTSLTSHDNCGSGVEARRTLTVSEELRVTQNGAFGATAIEGMDLGRSNVVASINGRDGLFTGSRLTLAGTLTASLNGGAGVWAQTIDLSGTTGSACNNGLEGIGFGGGGVQLGAVTICDNNGGGIVGKPGDGSGKQAIAGSIVGASILNNTGDGIRFEGGAAFTITASNLVDNTGLAINNLDASATIGADGNWWGGPLGPTGQVAGNVSAPTYLTAPVAGQDDDADGVPNAVEDKGPNGGDADGNGIPDRLQAQVAALTSAVDGRYIVLVTSAPTSIASARSVEAPAHSDVYGAGFIEASLRLDAGATADVELRFPVPPKPFVDLAAHAPRTRGAASEFYSLPAAIADSVFTLALTDGAEGDADLEVNGQIILIAGPGFSTPVARETESPPAAWGLESAFPNPFGPTLWLDIRPADVQPLTVQVFDLLGRSVTRTLRVPPGGGARRVRIDSASWPAGVYFVRLEQGGARQTRPVLKTM